MFSEYVVVSRQEHKHLLISDLEYRRSENDISSNKADHELEEWLIKDEPAH